MAKNSHPLLTKSFTSFAHKITGFDCFPLLGGSGSSGFLTKLTFWSKKHCDTVSRLDIYLCLRTGNHYSCFLLNSLFFSHTVVSTHHGLAWSGLACSVLFWSVLSVYLRISILISRTLKLSVLRRYFRKSNCENTRWVCLILHLSFNITPLRVCPILIIHWSTHTRT